MAGRKVSWKWGGKTYSGTLIPSMETKTHRFARTHNGKIKKLPKRKKKQLKIACPACQEYLQVVKLKLKCKNKKCKKYDTN